MGEQKVLTLLSGTQVKFDEQQTVLLPEVHDDIKKGDVVQLENEKREFLGFAEVEEVLIENFSLLQNVHLRNNAHPDLGSWPNAYVTLLTLVQGFSQNDQVTVVMLKATTVAQPGLTIQVSQGSHAVTVSAIDEEADITPSEEEIYAALNEPLPGEGEDE